MTNTMQQIENPENKRILVFDSQILNAIMNCHWYTYLTFIKNLRFNHSSEVMQRGSLIHDLFERYYKIKKHYQDNNKDFDVDFERIQEVLSDKAREIYPEHDYSTDEGEAILKAVQQNLERWRYDGLRIISVEEPFLVKIYENDELLAYLQGKIDLVAEPPNQPATPFDHKSRARKHDETTMNNQFIGYAFATNSEFVCVNEVGLQKILAPEDKHRRQTLSIPKGFQDRWLRNTQAWIKELDFSLQNNYWPMKINPYICAKCVFQDVCKSQSDNEVERKLAIHFHEVEPWDVGKKLENEAHAQVSEEESN